MFARADPNGLTCICAKLDFDAFDNDGEFGLAVTECINAWLGGCFADARIPFIDVVGTRDVSVMGLIVGCCRRVRRSHGCPCVNCAELVLNSGPPGRVFRV